MSCHQCDNNDCSCAGVKHCTHKCQPTRPPLPQGELVLKYPDCNGIYPHSITKEGCVYCKGLEDFKKAIGAGTFPALTIDDIDMKACTEKMFDLEAGGVNVLVTGLREEQKYQPGPWYCELIYKFYHWCQDWLSDLEDWAIIQENKARKNDRKKS